MNAVKSIFLLSVVCLPSISSGCRFGNSQLCPEDKVVRLSKREPSPLAKRDGNYRSGDKVMIIEDNGTLFSAEVKGICGELALVRRKSDGESHWMSSENGRPKDFSSLSEEIERVSPKGYGFEYGGKFKYYKWYPPERVFPKPWANNVNLKIGDVVYSTRHTIGDPEKGVVSEVPVESNGNFRVRFSSNTDSTPVDISEICSSIEPAKTEDLSSGDFVYYDKVEWAMVVGKRGDKIIIRQASSSKSDDIMVDISKLQILK